MSAGKKPSGLDLQRHYDAVKPRFVAADFIRESNRIDGIEREPTVAEIEAHLRFMALEYVTVADLIIFVSVFQPDAALRTEPGMNVRVGSHVAPRGGPQIKEALDRILRDADIGVHAHTVHCAYETLHPFTDGNGRSGRMLWLWQMREAPLGFLHTFYYQTLAAIPKTGGA